MKKIINADNTDRLLLALIIKYDCSVEDADEMLVSFKLNIICGEKIRSSIPLQAALLTAVNTASRAFKGGVFVCMPDSVKSILNWEGPQSLNDLVTQLGGTIISKCDDGNFTLTFGLPSIPNNNSLEVVCNSWQGGITYSQADIKLFELDNLALGGIAAGSLGVGVAFFRVSGIDTTAGNKPIGISLWRPDLDWLHAEATGISITSLPKKVWLLGLGHLGQAYLWTLSFLPFKDRSELQIMLQDSDKVVEANLSAGLLCHGNDIDKHKTRVSSDWLNNRGYKSNTINERKFDKNTLVTDNEPTIALCGFDNANSRLFLETAGFDLVIEAALGGTLSLFDNIILHTFPNENKPPASIWQKTDDKDELNKILHKHFSFLGNGTCGNIVDQIAGKSISSSFVGAFASSLVVAELLRSLHQGNRYEVIKTQLRNLKYNKAVIMNQYKLEAISNGILNV